MITNIRSGRERHSSAVLRFRNGSIIDASDDRNRSRRVRIFPLLITCPNWSITLITVSYGGEASRNDKISPLFPSPHQALFHPRVIPASPETLCGGGRAHLQRRETYPRRGKISPGSAKRRTAGPATGGMGGATEATPLLPPRGLAHFRISPFSRSDSPSTDRHRLFPSNEAG